MPRSRLEQWIEKFHAIVLKDQEIENQLNGISFHLLRKKDIHVFVIKRKKFRNELKRLVDRYSERSKLWGVNWIRAEQPRIDELFEVLDRKTQSLEDFESRVSDNQARRGRKPFPGEIAKVLRTGLNLFCSDKIELDKWHRYLNGPFLSWFKKACGFEFPYSLPSMNRRDPNWVPHLRETLSAIVRRWQESE